MNKYQLALNKIKALKIKPNDDPYMVCQLVEFIDTMQELIDDHTKLEKALDEAVHIIYMFAETNELFLKTETYEKYKKYICAKCKLHSDNGCLDGAIKDEECLLPQAYKNWKEFLLNDK